MKLFRKQFKPTVKFFLVFLAVSLTVYLLFKDTLNESFTDGKYVVVGVKFEGALSSVYNFFTNTDPTKDLPVVDDNLGSESFNTNNVVAELFKNPKQSLGPMVDKYPGLKFSIIDTSSDKVIYDPVAEYKTNKTMSPFPNTTNSATYIIYCSIYKSLPQSELKPLMMGAVSVCSSKDDNIKVFDAYKKYLAFKDAEYIEMRKPEVRNGSVKNAKYEIIKEKRKEMLADTILTSSPAFLLFLNFSAVKNINFVSFAYEDCTTNGFQDMEGFATTYSKLYDGNGTVISSAAIVEETVEKRQEATKSEPAANSNNGCCTIS
jgi:hypothetical protein